MMHGFGIIIACVFAIAIITALIWLYVYIYNDAKRRNMNAVLWVLLAIFAPSGIGIILYFLLRDPIAAFCVRCGTAMQPGFGYCPGCGSPTARPCPNCHRVPQPGWSHCASCGAHL